MVCARWCGGEGRGAEVGEDVVVPRIEEDMKNVIRDEWDRGDGEMSDMGLTSRWADRGIYGCCMRSEGADPRR